MATYITHEGLEKLKNELQERKTTAREEIKRRLKEAMEIGDLSENSEYDEARDSQSFNEGRIVDLEEMIKGAVIIENGGHKHAQVEVGATVLVKSSLGEKKFTIVGTAEADPINGFISNESPLGGAFLGHKKGDEVEVRTPAGVTKYKIADIK